jgi:hypothetical protein
MAIPTIAAHRAARKIHLDGALATGWKAKTPLGTICHPQDPPLDFASATESQHDPGLGGNLFYPYEEISGLGGNGGPANACLAWFEQDIFCRRR